MQEIQETQVQSLGQEDPVEEEVATCSSILVWEIPWTEEAGGLQSMRSQKVGHSWEDMQGNEGVGKPNNSNNCC